MQARMLHQLILYFDRKIEDLLLHVSYYADFCDYAFLLLVETRAIPLV